MSVFDWDKWNLGWAAGLPKNQMWGKIRSGKTDKNGEPVFQYDGSVDTASTDGALADVLSAHHFVAPAVGEHRVEHCFCGWTGEVHADHLAEEVEKFQNPEPVEPVKAAPKKVAAKKDDE